MEKKRGRPKTGQKKNQSFRLSDEMRERLGTCADRTKLDVSQIATLAIEAAVEAIEANNYRLVVPIEFEVRHIPTPVHPSSEQKEVG